MTTTRPGPVPIAVLLLLPLALSPSSCGNQQRRSPVRNVILLVVDTLRADRLSCYGYPRATTPTIDALAARGTLYENARSQGSNTRYSMISMLSGLYVTDEEERLPEAHPTLAERLRQGGKATAAFIGNATLARGTRGFERGFDHVEGPEIDGDPERTSGDSQAMFGKFRRWYAQNRDALRQGSGFFTWVQVMDPHIPYIIADEDRRKVAGPLPGEEQLRSTWQATPAEALAFLGAQQPAERDKAMQAMLAENRQYDAELAGLDGSIAKLLEFLEAQGELQHTLIVFASDHGEQLYERLKYPEETRAWFRKVKDEKRRTLKDLYVSGHGWSFHEQQWHTPLILVGPGIPAGVRHAGLVPNLDIYPTVLEACGLQPQSNLAGKSLFGGRAVENKEIFAYSLHTFAVIDERGWKYIDRRRRLPALLDPEDVDVTADGPAIELFNLKQDPAERHNLYAELPKQAQYFATAIDNWRRAHQRTTDTTLTDADRDALKQLGYLGDDAQSR